MISNQVYNEYLRLLLEGNRRACTGIVQDLLDRGIAIPDLYTDLFQKSLYHVGELWEQNRISVAVEHLATAVTEGLLNLCYPAIFASAPPDERKKIVISCAANEFHQIGGKMAADICEMSGWDSHFLGANTPVDHMLSYIQDTEPELVGLSLSVYFNMSNFKKGVEAIRSNFPHLDIIAGGQAFRWGGADTIKGYGTVQYMPSLKDLEKFIANT